MRTRARRILCIACLVASAAAPGAEPARVPPADREAGITARNWRRHPRIVEIRALVDANEGEVKAGRLRREARRCESPTRAFAADRIAFRDAARRIRKYVRSEGTDDSAYTLEHHYDERGRLRFAFCRSGAFNDAIVEHRLYFSEEGRLLWRDRRATGPGYPFHEDFPDGWLVRDPAAALEGPAHEGCL